MNLKTIAVTALTLISYLNTIYAAPAVVETADTTMTAAPTAETDTVVRPAIRILRIS